MSLSIDCHSHLSFLEDFEIEQILKEAKVRGPEQWVFGGYDESDWRRQLELKKNYPQRFHLCLGLHPWVIQNHQNEEIERQIEILKSRLDDTHFIGEIGLDFVKCKESAQKKRQIHFFEMQLQLGKARPRVLHCVKAWSSLLETLKNNSGRGFVHGFAGSLEVATSLFDLGYRISIGPMIFKSEKLKEVVKKVPMESLLLESDRPSQKGDSESPIGTYFKVVGEVAKIRSMEPEKLLEQISKNFTDDLSL